MNPPSQESLTASGGLDEPGGTGKGAACALPLKPYFGGKKTVARTIWNRFGNVDNYIEPFFGSGAVLLLRPHPPRVETINDLDCYVSNFWRATQHDPEATASHADYPVSEADLHARHRWLVLSDDARAFRERMRTDPDYFDAKVAGWWCWGLCCWIGSGWCQTPESAEWEQRPEIVQPGSSSGRGVHGTPKSKLRINGDNPGSVGKGVNAKGTTQQLPKLASADGVLSQQVPVPAGRAPGGVCSAGGLSQQIGRAHV